MGNTIPTKETIQTFVDAGSTDLAQHAFVSEKLNEKREKSIASANAANVDRGADDEKEVSFRLNQTGNIFYATTSAELQPETKKLFASVTVLFAAMTKALADSGKGIFDYDAWSAMIAKSGYFVEIQKLRKTLTIEKHSLSIDTQIIQQLLPGLTTGSSLDIAKGVLSSINGEYKSDKVTETTELGHLLFICEELFGAPSVTVRLFFATKKSHESVMSTPCYKSSSVKIEQLQEANTFLFVSPETIAEFAETFGEAPEAYNELIERLAGYITG